MACVRPLLLLPMVWVADLALAALGPAGSARSARLLVAPAPQPRLLPERDPTALGKRPERAYAAGLRMAPQLAALHKAHARLLQTLQTDEDTVRQRLLARSHCTSSTRQSRRGERLHDGWYSVTLNTTVLPIRAHPSVPESALFVAADRISRQMRDLPASVIERLIRRGAAIHIIGKRQVTTDLPEHRHLKGVRGALPGEVAEAQELDSLIQAIGRTRARQMPELRRRQQQLLPPETVTLDERSRGMGGLQASCAEENLLAPDKDPRYPRRCVLSHEVSHTVMDHGLHSSLRKAIHDCWECALEQGLWRRPDGTRAYAATSAGEYFAELSMWYWGTHGDFVDTSLCLPTAGPVGLARYDPNGFQLVGLIWSGKHPLYSSVNEDVQSVCKLRPVRATACSVVERGDMTRTGLLKPIKEVELEVDNIGGDSDLALHWVGDQGKRISYGTIAAGTCHVQRTYPGHVWEVQRMDGTSKSTGAIDKCRASSVARFRVSRHATSKVDTSIAFGI